MYGICVRTPKSGFSSVRLIKKMLIIRTFLFSNLNLWFLIKDKVILFIHRYLILFTLHYGLIIEEGCFVESLEKSIKTSKEFNSIRRVLHFHLLKRWYSLSNCSWQTIFRNLVYGIHEFNFSVANEILKSSFQFELLNGRNLW